MPHCSDCDVRRLSTVSTWLGYQICGRLELPKEHARVSIAAFSGAYTSRVDVGPTGMCSRSRVLRLGEHDAWVGHVHGPWRRRAITAPSQPPPTQPTTLPVTVAPLARVLVEASVHLGLAGYR